MIMQVWRGWTNEASAHALELFLCEENFQTIAGFHGVSVLRLDGPREVEFMLIMKFDLLDAVLASAEVADGNMLKKPGGVVIDAVMSSYGKILNLVFFLSRRYVIGKLDTPTLEK